MIRTKGNVIIDEIKIGDIHYEFDFGMCCKSEVISLPIRDDDGIWRWQSKDLKDGSIIKYSQSEKYSHYGLNLYDYEAYRTFFENRLENC